MRGLLVSESPAVRMPSVAWSMKGHAVFVLQAPPPGLVMPVVSLAFSSGLGE